MKTKNTIKFSNLKGTVDDILGLTERVRKVVCTLFSTVSEELLLLVQICYPDEIFLIDTNTWLYFVVV